MTTKHWRTITGNLASDPTTKTVPEFGTVVEFRVLHNKRVEDETGQWVKGPVEAYEVSMWGHEGEMVASKLRKGWPVIVFGSVSEHTFTRQDGTPGSSLKVTAKTVGVPLDNAGVQAWFTPARQSQAEQSSEMATVLGAVEAQVGGRSIA